MGTPAAQDQLAGATPGAAIVSASSSLQTRRTAGGRGSSQHVSGDDGTTLNQYNTQNVQHNTLNQQHVQQNLIDPAQLEQLVENTVQQRVDATISQMQMRVRDAVNRMEGQHNERLAQLQDEKNVQIQKVQAEAELMIERARQNIETERQMLRHEAEGHVASIQRQAEGQLAHTTSQAEGHINVLAGENLQLTQDRDRLQLAAHVAEEELQRLRGKLRFCGVGLVHKVTLVKTRLHHQSRVLRLVLRMLCRKPEVSQVPVPFLWKPCTALFVDVKTWLVGLRVGNVRLCLLLQ